MQVCEHNNCRKEGIYKAPKGRSGGGYYSFCLEHVRSYNAKWNYYEGMSAQELEEERRADMTWRRPTWPLHQKRFSRLLEEKQDMIPQKVKQAMAILDIKDLCSAEAVKRAYKEAVKKYHPDRHQGDTRWEEQLKRVNGAYEVISRYMGL